MEAYTHLDAQSQYACTETDIHKTDIRTVYMLYGWLILRGSKFL